MSEQNSANHIDRMKAILDNGEVPQSVTNKMIFTAIQTMWVEMCFKDTELSSDIHTIKDDLGVIKEEQRALGMRVTRLEEEHEKNPSMIAYVKENPRSAVLWIAGFIFVLTLALSFSEPLRFWLSNILP